MEVLKWKRSGSQGDEWKHGQISISRSEGTPLTVIMEAIRGKGYAGDIGIDDVSYKATEQGCPVERECTFESSSWSSTSPGLLCGWQQEKSKDDFDWSISTGGTASTKTGPKFDHTLQTKFGHYVYIESSYPRKKGDQAMMISQPHTATPGQCFTFFYHKYGLTVSNLTLLMRIDNVDSPVWSRGEYNEGPFWHPALVTLKSPKKQFQLIFQAFVGSSYTGDIALDDLLLKDGECPAPGNCDFEGFGQCSYVQDASEDDFDWIRGHGGTNSWRTGPKVDHTKNSKTGHYYYIEASSPRKQGDKARMISEIFEPTSRTTGRCLQFYRHMYGASTGTFNVYVKWERGNSSDAEQLIWTDSGNQGDSWIQSQAPVFSDKRFRLVFEAVRGSSYTGDIALDDINFNNNFAPCTYIPPNSQPPTVAPTTITPQDSNCTFDTPCRWKQVTSDDFDWTIKSGKTGSGGTGPLGDHTTGNGKYAFIEASSPRKPNDTAVLRSPPIRPKLGAVCMQFYYHMHGSHINRMNIYKVVNGRRIRVWTRYGTQGNQWRLGQANIRGVNSIFNIEIEGVRGVSYEGDISIDDIVLTDGKCKPRPYCDFENGQCGW